MTPVSNSLKFLYSFGLKKTIPVCMVQQAVTMTLGSAGFINNT